MHSLGRQILSRRFSDARRSKEEHKIRHLSILLYNCDLYKYLQLPPSNSFLHHSLHPASPFALFPQHLQSDAMKFHYISAGLVYFLATAYAAPARAPDSSSGSSPSRRPCGDGIASKIHDAAHCVFFFIPEGKSRNDAPFDFARCCPWSKGS